MKIFSNFLRKLRRVTFVASSPFKKLLIFVFMISGMYVLFFRKLLVRGVICNIFETGVNNHPDNSPEMPRSTCHAWFANVYYMMMCGFLVLTYFIFTKFIGTVFFYSPVSPLMAMVSRFHYDVQLGFNINFLGITFLLSYMVYMFMYIRGHDEPFISLLDRKKSAFAHSTYVVMLVFFIAFLYNIFI